METRLSIYKQCHCYSVTLASLWLFPLFWKVIINLIISQTSLHAFAVIMHPLLKGRTMMNLRDMKWTMTLVPFAEAQKTHYKGDPFKHDYFSLGSLL